MSWQAFVLRLIELLRPRFYNKITWLVVLSGLVMMSTPLWELVATEILKREFNISVSGSNDAAWGFALCVLGLAYHMANAGFYDLLKRNEIRARKEKERNHDIAIFLEARLFLNDQQIEDFVYTLQYDHSYYMDKRGQIEEFAFFLASTSNRFMTLSVAKAVERFIAAWSNLIRQQPPQNSGRPLKWYKNTSTGHVRQPHPVSARDVPSPVHGALRHRREVRGRP